MKLLYRLASAMIIAAALAGYACSGGNNGASASPTQPSSAPAPSTVVSVSVSGGDLTLTGKGQTMQLAATATLANGLQQDQTRAALWGSANPSVASVNSTGLVTAVASGSALISASYQGVSGNAVVKVSVPVMCSHVTRGCPSGC